MATSPRVSFGRLSESLQYTPREIDSRESSPDSDSHSSASSGSVSSMTEFSVSGYDYHPHLNPPSVFHASSENLNSMNTTQRAKLYDPDRFDPSQEQRAYVIDTTHNLAYDIIIRKSDEGYIVLVPVDPPQIKVPEHWKNWEDLGPAYGTDKSHISHCRKLTRQPRNLGRCFCFPVQYGNEPRIPVEAYDRQPSEE